MKDEPLVFLLPDREQGRHLCSMHAGFAMEAEQMCDHLLGSPRRSFARQLTEKEWLRGVSRMWELITRSDTMSDFADALK